MVQGDSVSSIDFSMVFDSVAGMTHLPTSDEIEALTPQQHKVVENRLRAAAARQGLRLVKSRRRDPRAIDFGTYWLLDVSTNGLVASDQFGLGLDDVARYLYGEGSK